MTRRLIVHFFLVVALAAGAAGCSSSGEEVADEGDFVLTLEKASDADAHVAALVRESGVATDAVETLNELYTLPGDIEVIFAAEDPDELGAYYDTEENTIVMPYAFLTSDRADLREFGYDTDEEADEAVLADLEYTLYHEVGHALIANLELPITGREEDAVDSLAAVILTETYESGGDAVLAAADWFAAVSENREDDYGFADFADTHSLNEQRYISLLCLVYGSDPEGYADLVDPELLPEERAEGCGEEYEQARSSWEELLAPYAKT